MADLKLGSQIGGNLIWHQGILDLNPSDSKLFYQSQEIITDIGGQTINGSLNTTSFNTNIATISGTGLALNSPILKLLTSGDNNGSGDGQTHIGYLNSIGYNHYFRGKGITRVDTLGGLLVGYDLNVSGNSNTTGTHTAGFVTASGNSTAYRGMIVQNAGSGWSYLELRANSALGQLAVKTEAYEDAVANSMYLRPNGGSSGSLIIQPNSAMIHKTSNGYIKIGSLNATYAHFDTDRPTFYFYKPMVVNGEVNASSFRTSGSVVTTGTMYINNTSPTICYQDSDNLSAFTHLNSSKFYVLRGNAVNSTSYDTGPNGRHPMIIDLVTGNVNFSGSVFGNGVEVYSPTNKPTNTDVGLSNYSNTSSATHGSVSIAGSKSNYSGIHFSDVNKVFMLGNTNNASGVFNSSTSQWDWYFQNGSLVEGIIPWARLSNLPDYATRWPTPAEASSLPRSLMNQSSTSVNGELSLIASNYLSGKCLYTDIDFNSGTNSVTYYNNSGATGVVLTRIDDALAPNKSKKVLKLDINPSLGTSPGFGGFIQSIQSRANAIFVQVFVAKLDIGRSFYFAENSMGTGTSTYFLTSNAGTGKYERYIRVTMCGSSGTFSGGGHIYVTGGASTQFQVYLAECTCYDLTDVSAPYSPTYKPTNVDLNLVSRAGDTMTGQLVVNANITSSSFNTTTATISGNTTTAKVLVTGSQGTEANSLTRKDYVDAKVGTAVQSVTASLPIVSSGGANPVISINLASNSANGAMSANDKAKLDGIPSDALSRSGGTMTGNITYGRTTIEPNVLIYSDSSSSAASGVNFKSSPTDAPIVAFGSHWNGTAKSITSAFVVGTGSNWYNGSLMRLDPVGLLTTNSQGTLYGTSRKPTPAEIGALDLSGGTITGNLTVNGAVVGNSRVVGVGTGNTYTTAGLEARVNSGVAGVPSISFHKAGSYAGTLRMVDTNGWAFVANENTGTYGDLVVRNLTGSDLNATGGIGVTQTAGLGVGISLYGGANGSGKPDYGLMFAQTQSQGTHGYVTGDWATYFTMTGASNRGWVFKLGTNNIASIAADGSAAFGGNIQAGSWIRTLGNTGWYNDTYAGGIYMEDTAWVRIYNGKKFYVSNTASDAINTAGGVTTVGDVTVGRNVGCIGDVYGRSFYGNANIGGTGSAINCPGGIYSQGTNWLYGQIITSNNPINAGTGTITSGIINASGRITSSVGFTGNGSQLTNLNWNNITGKPADSNIWVTLYRGTPYVNRVNLNSAIINYLTSGNMVKFRVWLNRSGAANSERFFREIIVDGSDGWSGTQSYAPNDVTWSGVSYCWIRNAHASNNGVINCVDSQYSNIFRVDYQLL